MKMPPPREVGSAFRRLEEAKTGFIQNPDGRITMEVHHPIVEGVTVEMVQWWFGVYAHQQVKVKNETLLAFLLWHPYDHVWIARRDKGSQDPLMPGDRIRISEAYGRNEKYQTDETITVVQRDAKGYILRAVRLGMTVADLEYCYMDTPEGLEVTTRLYVGVADGWAKTLVNQIFVPLLFDEQKTEAWMKHNVEEVGNWAHFLPQLFDKRNQAGVIDLDLGA